MRGESALLYANEIGLDPPGITRLRARRATGGERRCSAVGLLILLSALSCAAGAAAAQTAAPTELVVGRFVVEDGDARLAADTDRLLAPLRGRPVTLEAIQAVAAKIQQRYVDRGYFMVLVSAPAQTVGGGDEFHLHVIRRAIRSVDVEGVPKALSGAGPRVSDAVLGRRNSRARRFQRAVLLAGALPSLNLKSTLEAGPTDDAVTLVLTGEYRAFTNVMSFDNAMPAIVGRNSATLISAYNPAARFVDQVSFALAHRRRRRRARIAFAAAAGRDRRAHAARDFRRRTRLALYLVGDQTDLADERRRCRRGICSIPTAPISEPRCVRPIRWSRSAIPRVLATAGFDATSLTQSANPFAASLFDDQTRVLRVGLSLDHVFDPATAAAIGGRLVAGHPWARQPQRRRSDASVTLVAARRRRFVHEVGGSRLGAPRSAREIRRGFAGARAVRGASAAARREIYARRSYRSVGLRFCEFQRRPRLGRSRRTAANAEMESRQSDERLRKAICSPRAAKS